MAQANIKAVITAENRANSALTGFANNIENLGDKVANTSKRAVQAFALGTAAAVTFAIKSASAYEQNRVAFDTMLGSVEAGGSMLKKLSDFARKTPFDLPQVVEGAQRLLAYNIEADKLIPTLTALGNITAGVGREKLPFLILALGQVKAAGRLTGAELRQFTEAGVPLLELLAKQSGKTAGDIKAAMENGAAPSFAEVEKALFSASAQGGKFFNLMEKQSKTFGGTMSNIHDQIGRVARNIVGISETGDIRDNSIFSVLKNNAQDLLFFLDKNSDNIANSMVVVSRSVNDAFSGISNIAKIVGDYINPKLQALFLTLQTQLLPALRSLWTNVILPLIPAIGGSLVIAIGLAIDVFNGLLNIVLPVVNFFIANKDFLVPIIGAFIGLKASMALNAAFAALTVLFNTFAVKTIPAAIAKTVAFQAVLSMPLVMPAIAVGAALAALGLVIQKFNETKAVVNDAANSIANARNQSAKTDAAVKSMFEKGKISLEKYQTYLNNTQRAADSTKDKLYTGFFGPLNKSFDNLFVRITNTQDKYKGSGFGGFATGGYTGRGGINEVAGVVHRGEYVLRKDQVDQSTGRPKTDVVKQPSDSINITIQAGAFMGTQMEARKYAMMIMSAYKDAMSAKGRV